MFFHSKYMSVLVGGRKKFLVKFIGHCIHVFCRLCYEILQKIFLLIDSLFQEHRREAKKRFLYRKHCVRREKNMRIRIDDVFAFDQHPTHESNNRCSTYICRRVRIVESSKDQIEVGIQLNFRLMCPFTFLNFFPHFKSFNILFFLHRQFLKLQWTFDHFIIPFNETHKYLLWKFNKISFRPSNFVMIIDARQTHDSFTRIVSESEQTIEWNKMNKRMRKFWLFYRRNFLLRKGKVSFHLLNEWWKIFWGFLLCCMCSI